MPNSPTILQRAAMPSTRQGCAEILGDRYHGKIPLPQIPKDQAQDTVPTYRVMDNTAY